MMRSMIRVNRMVVTRLGTRVYDQPFHLGVNVIRGDNGVGKSTLLDIMFYGMGGDLKKTEWKKESLRCDTVVLELTLNESRVLTLRREITNTEKAPIHFFAGDIDTAISSADGWVKYSYMRSENQFSFSQQLFELLGYEHSKTDEYANLTMHQLLRLIYVDQNTPVTRLLRLEDFRSDRDSMRLAIGEFLLGFDNLDAYRVRQELLLANRAFDKAKNDLDAIFKFLGTTGEKAVRTELINQEIAILQSRLIEISEKREQIRKAIGGKTNGDAADKRAREAAEALDKASKESAMLTEQVAVISHDIADTTSFLEALDARAKSLLESKTFAETLGVMAFKYCPSCLQPVQKAEDNHCGLCHSEMPAGSQHDTYLQMINEIHFQKKESERVLSLQESTRSRFLERLQTTGLELDRLRLRVSELGAYASSQEEALNELSREAGYCESQIGSLIEKLSAANAIEELIRKKSGLNEQITELKTRLEQLESAATKRRDRVRGAISDLVVAIVKKDEGYEDAFERAQKFVFDFSSDGMLLDDVARFSASSNTFLKNAFHVAVLVASTTDPDMRYPRLLLLDNIEDKGMVAERSQSFQRIMLGMCRSIKAPFQIIVTTSMVAPELDTTEFGIGPFYKKGTHTLAV